MSASSSLPFGVQLKLFRHTADLTQEELAGRAGYSVVYISKLERGERVPLPVTVAQIAQALELAPEAQAALQAAAQRSRKTRIRVALQPPLVGRQQEVRLLDQHLAGTGPPVLLLAGEPGIGKTRLLQEAVGRAGARGWTVLEGGCHRRSGQEPYAPLAGALERFLAQRSPAEQRVALHGCDWLVHLLPELAGVTTLAPAALTVPPEQARRLLFVAVRRLLTNLAESAGTLLVLDDLQWASTDALDLLTSLLHPMAPPSLRVLGAYRDTEVQAPDPLGLLLTDLAREGLVTRRNLGPLAPQDAKALLDLLLEERGNGKREAAVERVLAQAAGVPYFLVSCAQALREEGPEARREEALPWQVAETIRQRVALLPETAQYLLEAAAVVGRPIERTLFLTLAAQQAWGRREVLSALEGACRARLLVEEGEADYQFAHDLVRDVLVRDLSAARRAALHQQVAEALEQGTGDPPVEQLAYHYQRAGSKEKALFYLERAGDRAQAVYAAAEAARLYQELVEQLAQRGRPGDLARGREKLSDMLVVLGRHTEALAVLEAARADYRAIDDLEGLLRITAKLGHLHGVRGTVEEGIELLRPWLDVREASRLSEDSQARLTLTLAYLFQNSGRYQEALGAAQQAGELAARAPDLGLLRQAKWYLGRSLILLYRLDEAIATLEALLPLTEEAGDLLGHCQASLNLSWAYEHRGDYYQGKRSAACALEVARRIENPVLVAQALTSHAFSAFRLGEWQLSRQEYEQALALMRQADLPLAAASPLLKLGTQLLAEGQGAMGVSYLEEAIALAQRSREMEALCTAHGALAEHDMVLQRPQLAIERLEPLLEDPESHDAAGKYLFPCLAVAYLEVGKETQAQQVLDQTLARATAQQMRLLLADTRNAQAMLAMRQGRWQAAEEMLAGALEEYRALPAPYGEVKALAAWGSLSLQQREREQAGERFAAALAICARLGERLYAQRIEQALANMVTQPSR
jgi:tetratricopeptide (TPR) repeat protein/transcriptional regulator with XRE-family HTH domain